MNLSRMNREYRNIHIVEDDKQEKNQQGSQEWDGVES